MFYVSEIKREAPEVFATPLQKKVYETLAQNNIPFGRVDTDPGITMEDCRTSTPVTFSTRFSRITQCLSPRLSLPRRETSISVSAQR